MTWEAFKRPRRQRRRNIEFERFEALTRQLLQVPKADVADSPQARLSWDRKHAGGPADDGLHDPGNEQA